MSKTNGTGLAIQRREPLAQGGRVVRHSQRLDSSPSYLTDAPDPATFASTIQSADDGYIGDLLRLNEEMEAKDAHLQSVASTRRRALTALDWSIEPVENVDKQDLADKAAAYIQEQLEGLHTFEATLEHLSTAIGPGLAVSELVWEKARLIETVDVPGHRLKSDPLAGNAIRIETEDNWDGIEAVPGKFVIYAPNTRAGYPIAVTMTRACAWLYIMKHYSRADWSSFSELFGMPFRVAMVADSVPDATKTTIGLMLRDMTSDGWAVLPGGVTAGQDVDVKLLESTKGDGPYKSLIEWAESKQSILYLGQTGTTEIGAHGSYAAIKVHDNVRADILRADIKNEARMIRDGIIRPMCQFKWPRREVPLPKFVREIHEQADIEGDRLKMDRLRMGLELGLMVDEDVKYELLGIPKPKPVEAAPPDEERPEEIEDGPTGPANT